MKPGSVLLVAGDVRYIHQLESRPYFSALGPEYCNVVYANVFFVDFLQAWRSRSFVLNEFNFKPISIAQSVGLLKFVGSESLGAEVLLQSVDGNHTPWIMGYASQNYLFRYGEANRQAGTGNTTTATRAGHESE